MNFMKGHMPCMPLGWRLKEEEARLEMQRRSLGMLQQAWWVRTLEIFGADGKFLERSGKQSSQIFSGGPFQRCHSFCPEWLHGVETSESSTILVQSRRHQPSARHQPDISQTSGTGILMQFFSNFSAQAFLER